MNRERIRIRLLIKQENRGFVKDPEKVNVIFILRMIYTEQYKCKRIYMPMLYMLGRSIWYSTTQRNVWTAIKLDFLGNILE